jgi:SAM-dependent methyltransferase
MHSQQSEQPGFFSRSLSLAIKHITLHGLRYSVAALWREIWFDLARGVETSAPQYHLQSPHSIPYQGADPKVVAKLLQALPPRALASTFIDFGCGKGRALLLALEHGFNAVTGVEIAPGLAAVCRRNLLKANKQHTHLKVRVIEADATTFALPAGPLTAFFFNPFHGPPLEQVALNLANHARQNASEVWLIYVNPLHLKAFTERGFNTVHTLSHRGTLLATIAHIEGGVGDNTFLSATASATGLNT